MNPLSIALKQVKKRWCSVNEIEKILRDKDFDEEAIDQVVQKLKEMDLLNDLRFAKAWIHDRDLFLPRGEYLLKRELEEKGVSSQDIQTALSERVELNPNIEEEMALKVLESKSGRYSKTDDLKQKKRMSDLLLRRGFSFELIRRILSM